MMVHLPEKKSTIITIFSTASAVGKSVLAVNITAELAKQNFKVCIVDLDLQFGDVCHYLKLKPEFSIYHYQEADKLSGNGVLDNYLLKYNEHLSVLAAPAEIEESYNIETQTVLKALDYLKTQYDYIILDTASGFSDINLVVMDSSDIILFVGILDFIPTIKNMKIGYATMLKIGYPKEKIRFVLNRSNAKKNISIKDVEDLLEESFYHVLPNAFVMTLASIRAGVPMVSSIPANDYGEKVKELVDKLLNRSPKKGSSSGLGSWVKRLFT